MCHQIWVIHKERSVKGISLPFFVIGMLSYDMWVLSGVIGHSLALLIGQGPGAILCLIIIGQVVWYRYKGCIAQSE